MKFALHRRPSRPSWPVSVICRVLQVSAQRVTTPGAARPPARQAQRQRASCWRRSAAVHGQNRGCYGSPRVHRALLADGDACLREHRGQADAAGQDPGQKPARRSCPAPPTAGTTSRWPDNVLDRDFAARRARPQVGGGHHLRAHRRGLAVPGGGAGPVLAARSSAGAMADHLRTELVGRRACRWPCSSGGRTAGAAAPQRPRRAVRQRRLPASAGRARDRAQHEPAAATATTTR